jgi:SAM-dependent methyltransferase
MCTKKIKTIIIHTIFRLRRFNNNSIKKFAKGIRHKTILEIGSGKKHNDSFPYSVKKYFHTSNNFIQSDIVPKYGHRLIDVTKMKFRNRFDIIICMNVLEHVFSYEVAIKNIRRALKPHGTAIFFLPAFYPLHDQPHDYWRFTEYSIVKMLGRFKHITMRHSGLRRYPFAYYIEATK